MSKNGESGIIKLPQMLQGVVLYCMEFLQITIANKPITVAA
jgi:hypothetical protein